MIISTMCWLPSDWQDSEPASDDGLLASSPGESSEGDGRSTKELDVNDLIILPGVFLLIDALFPDKKYNIHKKINILLNIIKSFFTPFNSLFSFTFSPDSKHMI